MREILEIALTNAATATILGVPAALSGRWIKRPAVVHALWVLVLVGLLRPPVLRIGILPAWGSSESVSAATTVATTRTGPDGKTQRGAIELADIGNAPGLGGSASSRSATSMSNAEGNPGSLWVRPGNASLRGPDPSVASAGSDARSLRTAGGSSPVPVLRNMPGEVTTDGAADRSDFRSRASVAASNVEAALARLPWAPIEQGLMIVWLAGMLAVIALGIWRAVRFTRSIRGAAAATAGLSEEMAAPAPALSARVQALAGRVGLRRAPAVRIVESRISPLVWPRLRGPVILFPARLLEGLSESERDALLLHELAHVRRRDHWVRLIECAAAAAFWWHPLLSWARRQMRRAEERACDEMVVCAAAGRTGAYARGLMKTVEFLSGTDSRAPAFASGLGAYRLMEERLTMIVQETTPRRLTRLQAAALAVFAAAVLIAFPSTAARSATASTNAAPPAPPAAASVVDEGTPAPPALPAPPAPPAARRSARSATPAPPAYPGTPAPAEYPPTPAPAAYPPAPAPAPAAAPIAHALPAATIAAYESDQPAPAMPRSYARSATPAAAPAPGPTPAPAAYVMAGTAAAAAPVPPAAPAPPGAPAPPPEPVFGDLPAAPDIPPAPPAPPEAYGEGASAGGQTGAFGPIARSGGYASGRTGASGGTPPARAGSTSLKRKSPAPDGTPMSQADIDALRERAEQLQAELERVEAQLERSGGVKEQSAELEARAAALKEELSAYNSAASNEAREAAAKDIERAFEETRRQLESANDPESQRALAEAEREFAEEMKAQGHADAERQYMKRQTPSVEGYYKKLAEADASPGDTAAQLRELRTALAQLQAESEKISTAQRKLRTMIETLESRSNTH
jgi:beta-lactamase regulating signal transducer with metallopeptidase domain